MAPRKKKTDDEMGIGQLETGDVFKVVGGTDGKTIVEAVSCPVAARELFVSRKQVLKAVQDGRVRGDKVPGGTGWYVEYDHLREILESPGAWLSLGIKPGRKSKDE